MTDTRTLIEKIESCGFECEAGPLHLSMDWQRLRDLLAALPQADERSEPMAYAMSTLGARIAAKLGRADAAADAQQMVDESFFPVRDMARNTLKRWQARACEAAAPPAPDARLRGLQRFNLVAYPEQDPAHGVLLKPSVDPHGEWVRYADLEASLRAHEGTGR